MPAVNAHIYTLKWDLRAFTGPRNVTLLWDNVFGVPPDLGSEGNEVYEVVRPLAPNDEFVSWALAYYVGAITGMYQEAADWGRDSGDRPGWAILMDINTCPDIALPWLAQFVGVDITGLDPTDARAKMIDQPQRRRGTPGRMVEAVAETLTGTKTVIARWRFSGATAADAPFYFEIITLPSETPDPAATEKVALREKWAPLILTYACEATADWYSIYQTYATWADVLAHGTWNASKNDPIS